MHKNILSKFKSLTAIRKRRISSRSEMHTSNEHKQLHTPVMLEEVIFGLNIRANSTVLDMTFGCGGHTEEILKRNPDCHVVVLDRDEKAIEIATKLSQTYRGHITPLLGKFSEAENLLRECGFDRGSIDGVLIDAGCSSMQLDQSSRGFSLSKDGPLDMRMDGNRITDQLTAADVVNNLNLKDLHHLIYKYGDETHSKQIATSIIENRPISTTKQLAEAVGNSFSIFNHMSRSDKVGRRRHSATKTFMALRIFINDELNELYSAVKTAEKYLSSGGRLNVITFHSLESKVVKEALRDYQFQKSQDENERKSPWLIEKRMFCNPAVDEVQRNPRSRSATLHIATKT